jgi:hypothetical protein
MALHIYRVTVRGHFGPLAPEVRARLAAEAAAHDNLDAAFTEAGTFTYDRNLVAFSFRYQLRVQAEGRDEADAAAADEGRSRAEASLAAGGITTKGLRATAANLGDVWDRSRNPSRARRG